MDFVHNFFMRAELYVCEYFKPLCLLFVCVLVRGGGKLLEAAKRKVRMRKKILMLFWRNNAPEERIMYKLEIETMIYKQVSLFLLLFIELESCGSNIVIKELLHWRGFSPIKRNQKDRGHICMRHGLYQSWISTAKSYLVPNSRQKMICLEALWEKWTKNTENNNTF